MTKKIFLFLTVFLSISISTFAQYTDVEETNPNIDIIHYLTENEIINGYQDGTFRPENKISRAEFLKILLESENIPLDNNDLLKFTDIDQNGWYIPYIKKAYFLKIISGYSNNTFRPDQTISLAEGLKIIAKVHNWSTTLPEGVYLWETPYVNYALNHNILNEPNAQNTSLLLSREQTCLIIYRSLLNKENIAQKDLIPQNTNKDFFDNLSFNGDFPNIFYKNEIYIFSGHTKSILNFPQTISVVLQNKDKNTTEDYPFIITESNFKIPVYFKEPGNYYIGFIVGSSGKSKATEIKIINNILLYNQLSNATEIKTQNTAKLEYGNSQAKINFGNSSKALKKIKIYQNQNIITYLNRQNETVIPLLFKDFKKFHINSVTIGIEQADMGDNSLIPVLYAKEKITFKEYITEHNFSFIDSKKITADIPNLIESTGPVSIKATVKTDVFQTGFLTTPNGQVQKIEIKTGSPTTTYFNEKIIKTGSEIGFNFNAEKQGKYILEINDKNSQAIINHPIYVGSKKPLIPDFFDLNKRQEMESVPDMETLKTTLFAEINKSRQTYDLPLLQKSEELDILAQNHANDMAQNNYFSHINLQNKTPDDRRIALNIKTPVSENIAKDLDIYFAHQELMRSGSHRSTILDGNNQRIGIGIAVKDGYLYIVEEFSTFELTPQNLENNKTLIIGDINKKRLETRLTVLSYDSKLETISKELNLYKINSENELTNTIFVDTLNKYGINTISEAVNFESDSWPEIQTRTLSESTITNSGWNKMGLDITVNKVGTINLMLILSQ